jgi:uncharacterized protein DUF397
MTWRKSSRSSQEGGCVEIRGDLSALRDSKHPDGPTLHTTGIRHMLRFVKASSRNLVAGQRDQ